jgi:hypothetical protein
LRRPSTAIAWAVGLSFFKHRLFNRKIRGLGRPGEHGQAAPQRYHQ